MKSALFSLLAIFLLICSCQNQPESSNPEPDPEPTPVSANMFSDDTIVAIYKLKQAGDFDSLSEFLEHENPKYRAVAAQVLGSAEAVLSVTVELLLMLSDDDLEVRKSAAFTLGQYSDPSTASFMVEIAEKENDPEVLASLLVAIGRSRGKNESNFLVGFPLPEEEVLQVALATGLYHFGISGFHSKECTSKVIEILEKASSAQARMMAANYLSRANIEGHPVEAPTILRLFNEEKDADTRLALFSSLRKFENAEIISTAQSILENQSDYRLKVNAIRVLASKNDARSTEIIRSSGFADENYQVSLTAAQALSRLAQPKDAEWLFSAGTDQTNLEIQAMLWGAALQLEPGNSDYSQKILEAYETAETPHTRAVFLTAYAKSDNSRAKLMEIIHSQASPPEKSAAIAALTSWQPEEASDKEEIANIIMDGLFSGDVGMVYYCAQNFEKANLVLGHDPETLLHLIDSAKQTCVLPRQAEGYLELEKARMSLTGEYPDEKPKLPDFEYRKIDWEKVKSIPTDQQVEVRTTKGSFRMQLDVETAPTTVVAFLALVEEGFYTLKPFHRIVPNFVAQGGCPRGDGFGAPDFSLRSEFSTRPYLTGSVGMASAGRDTESCQWFVTHSPTPHLDGNYTLFAHITEGQDIVDALEMGDKILEIKVL